MSSIKLENNKEYKTNIKSPEEIIAAYGRTSTRNQVIDLTIENQRIELDREAKNKNYKIYDYYFDDGVTSAKPITQRPQGFRLFQDAAAGKFKKVLVLKADRFGRDLLDSLIAASQLEKYGVALVGVYENLEDDFMKGLHLLLAQKEKSDIILRFNLGRQRVKSEGRWVDGNPPYGFIINKETGKLEIFELEAAIVRRIYNLCVVNKLSCPKIAEILNREGVPAFTEGKNKKVHRENVRGRTVENAKFWYSARIVQILKDSVYKGKKELGKKSKGKNIRILEVEPIVSEKIWSAAQEVLKNNKIESIRNRKRSYCLAGLIYCASCKRKYSGLVSHGSLYYGCNGYRLNSFNSYEKCFNKNIRANEIEQTVWSDVKDFIKNPVQIKRFLMERQKALAKVDFNIEIGKVEASLKKIEKDVDTLLDLDIAEDSLAKKRIEKKLSRLNKEYEKLHETKEQLIKLQKDSASEEYYISEIERNLASFNSIIDNPTSEQKAKILKLIVDKIYVSPRNDKKDQRIVEVIYKFNKDACFIAKLDPTG